MEITNTLKAMYCKLYNIPINLYVEPYFSDRIDLLEDTYKSRTKFNMFVQSLSLYRSEEDYIREYDNVKFEVLSYIKRMKYFDMFEAKSPEYLGKNEFEKYSHKSIYCAANDGKTFISIDMNCANFNAMKHAIHDSFGGAKTWELFMRKFTNNQCFCESKSLRQFVFGNCNPKRQIEYEKMNMIWLLNDLIDCCATKEENVFAIYHDEIILEYNNNLDEVKRVTEHYTTFPDIGFSVEKFKLVFLGEQIGYMKLYDDFSYKLKCVDNDLVHIVTRMLNNGEIDPDDLYFRYKHALCHFEEVPDYIRNSEAIRNYYVESQKRLLKNKIETILGCNNEDGSYLYELNRVKSAELEVGDFTEISDETIDSLVDGIIEVKTSYDN